MSDIESKRCSWAGSDPLMIAYHDQEWGRPVYEETALFEFLTLEGAQAGLSWLTILRKREGYRKAFAGFDPQRVAGFDSRRIDQLVLNPDIVRHRGKIESTVNNARRILSLWNSGQTLAGICWELVDGKPLQHKHHAMGDVASRSAVSAQLSKRLKKLGFRFVGDTTCYSFLQAAGLVNDHLLACPQHAQCLELGLAMGQEPRLAAGRNPD
ncbi:MAG TPA: DNA-3-methyladenine glycosylase I [Xanthomonadales bacterium]|nr:DNA-3-methyladenine glycosylase I [Xanthomonadales bacterium]